MNFDLFCVRKFEDNAIKQETGNSGLGQVNCQNIQVVHRDAGLDSVTAFTETKQMSHDITCQTVGQY